VSTVKDRKLGISVGFVEQSLVFNGVFGTDDVIFFSRGCWCKHDSSKVWILSRLIRPLFCDMYHENNNKTLDHKGMKTAMM
jgi:hypothetical protein